MGLAVSLPRIASRPCCGYCLRGCGDVGGRPRNSFFKDRDARFSRRTLHYNGSQPSLSMGYPDR